MNKKYLTILSSNLDHNPDFITRKEKIKKTFSEYNFDFYTLQEIDKIKDIEYIIPKNYHYLKPTKGGNTIISKTKAIKSYTIKLGDVDAISGLYNLGCHTFLVISTHFTWGTGKEYARLENAYKLNKFIDKIAPLDANRSTNEIYTILAGDLNAEPDHSSIRYLTGKESYLKSSTQFTDPFENYNNNHTSSNKNKFFIRTAKENNFLYPKLIPNRRIDYILLRGFAHGRVGAGFDPITHNKEPFLYSDHYPISVKVIC